MAACFKGFVMATQKGDPVRRQKAELVFAGMRSGMSALKSCAKIGLSQSCLNDWLNADPDLAADYARARSDLIELYAEQTMKIADEPVALTAEGKVDTGAVQKQRLQVDTRKWLLSKMAPKKYGDKIEVSGDASAPLTVQILTLSESARTPEDAA